MNSLVNAFFERDLTAAEEARLQRLLERSEKDALDFSQAAERHYAALGLTAAALIAAKLAGGKAAAAQTGGWAGKLITLLKALTLKTVTTTVVVTAVVVGATAGVVKLIPHKTATAPAAPQEGDGLVISLELAAPRTLEVTVFDGAGQAVRHFGSRRYEAGGQRLIWDGLDDAGKPVAAGSYRVNVGMGAKSMDRWLQVR